MTLPGKMDILLFATLAVVAFDLSYVSRKGTEMLMVPGFIFTIEPMINMGSAEIFIDEKNDWVVYTADGMPSAQWEIQVLVTNDGYEILAY